MKLSKKWVKTLAASAIAASALTVPAAAQAELNSSMAFSNMYLWRGVNLSRDSAAISGSIDYSTSGLYFGIWTSSAEGGHETDLYVGYSGSAGGIDYDVSFWNYLYPEKTDANGQMDLRKSDNSEIVGSISMQGFTGALYISVDSDTDDDKYLTVSYGLDKYTFLLGIWDRENPDTVGHDEYSHITVNYTATDELSFAVSIANSDNNETEESPLFQVTYSRGFDLSK